MNAGWISPQEGQRSIASFETVAPNLTGTATPQQVVLYPALTHVWGKLKWSMQLADECVGWAFAGSVDILACIDVLTGARAGYTQDQRTSTEAIYAMSRERAGWTAADPAGSRAVFAAWVVTNQGTISRQDVMAIGHGTWGAHDYRRLYAWVNSGLPAAVVNQAAQQKIAGTAPVANFSEACDAIANGYPVTVGSLVGLTRKRDQQGFCRASGAELPHCMKFIGYQKGLRPGLLCMDSLIPHEGPKVPADLPDGCFWVDEGLCNQMLAEGDSFALGQFAPAAPFVRRVEQLVPLLA